MIKSSDSDSDMNLYSTYNKERGFNSELFFLSSISFSYLHKHIPRAQILIFKCDYLTGLTAGFLISIDDYITIENRIIIKCAVMVN